MFKTKRLISIILVFALLSGLSINVSANDNSDVIAISPVTYTSEESMQKDMQNQVDKHLNALIEADSKTRDQYDWTYSTEYGSPKYVTKSGYAGGQNPGGVKFDYPGGAFSWTPSGGPTISASVSFSIPFKSCTINVDLGVAEANNSLEYIQAVNNYTDFVKLYIYKTMKVTPYVIYRTNIHTGVTEIYSNGHTSVMHNYQFEVRKV